MNWTKELGQTIDSCQKLISNEPCQHCGTKYEWINDKGEIGYVLMGSDYKCPNDCFNKLWEGINK